VILKGGEEKEIEVILHGTRSLQSGPCKVRVAFSEKYYHMDPDPVVAEFQTMEFQKPHFIAKLTEWKDDKLLFPKNDGDGKAELGEFVGVDVGIGNDGLGDAENLRAIVRMQAKGLHFRRTPPRNMQIDTLATYNIGHLASGDTAHVRFYFFTTPDFTLKEVPFQLALKETRAGGERDTLYNFAIPLDKYGHRQIDIRIHPVAIHSAPRTPVLFDTIDVDRKIRVHARKKDRIAVIIGIESYKNLNSTAKYAHSDARSYYRYATDLLGISEKNIKLLIDSDATKGELENVFTRGGWLERRIRAIGNPTGTEIFVFYSGHGLPDVKKDEPYLLAYDCDPDNPATGYHLKDILRSIEHLGAGFTYMFLDCCFSGLDREGQLIIAGRPARIVVDYHSELHNIAIFSACSSAQYSRTYDEMKHGIFSYFVLKGLRGAADANGDKILEVAELASYVRKNVVRTSADLGPIQEPSTRTTDPSRIILEYE